MSEEILSMAACVPVLDLPVGYKRKLSFNEDTARYSQSKVQRVEHEEFCFTSEVKHEEGTSLIQQKLVRDPSSLAHAANYLELSDIQTVKDQLHVADTLMDFSSFDETSINHDSSTTTLPSSDKDNVLNACATDLVQPHLLTNPTALIDNNVINLDDDNNDEDEVYIVINLEGDDDEANSVLQQSITTAQTIHLTEEVKESSLKGNNDVQPCPTVTDFSFLDSSVDSQMQHSDNDQDRIYDDSHTIGIGDDLDFMKFMDFEKLDFYGDDFDLIGLGCDSLELAGTDSLVDTSFPCFQQPTIEVKESNGIEVVIID